MDTSPASATLQRTSADRLAAMLGTLMLCGMGVFFIVAPYVNNTDLANKTIVPLFGIAHLVFAAMAIQTVTNYVRVDAEGIHQRDKLHQHTVRWADIGAYALAEEMLLIFNHSQSQMLLQIEMKTQPERGGWTVRSRKEFEELLTAKMVEHKIENLQMLRLASDQVTFVPPEKDNVQ